MYEQVVFVRKFLRVHDKDNFLIKIVKRNRLSKNWYAVLQKLNTFCSKRRSQTTTET